MIDHTGHAHPSTPAMRALCRANGGTGNVTPKKAKMAKGSTTKRAPKAEPRKIMNVDTGKVISREEAAKIMFGTKSAGVKGSSAKKRTPQLTEAKVPKAEPKKLAAAQMPKKRITRERHEALMKASDDEDNQLAALASAPVGISEGEYRGFQSEEEKRAAKRYVQAGYGPINSHLRGSHQGNEDTQQQIADLDAVMDRSKLSQDVGVFRGVESGRALFGDALDGDMTGFKWREKAFSSTSVNEDVADDFTLGEDDDEDFGDDDDDGDDPRSAALADLGVIKMRIVLPKGTKAIEGSGIDLEAELILGRDSDFEVIRDRGVDPSGIRILDVELVAQGGKNVA